MFYLQIKSEGVTVFGVGGFNEEEVNEIASNPDSTYAFAYSGFLTFSTLLKDTLINKVCFAPAVLPVKYYRFEMSENLHE